MSELKTPRRERERQRHRQEILDAARRIVADRGLEGVTVEQVAKEAEFAVGSIYRHFNSKEALIQELMGEFADEMLDDLAALAQEPAPFEQRLEQFVRHSLARQAECQPLFEAMLALPGALPLPGSELARGMQRVHERYLAMITELIAEGEAAGLVRSGARLANALALAALLHGYSRILMAGLAVGVIDPGAEVLRSFLDGARARPAVESARARPAVESARARPAVESARARDPGGSR